LFENTKICGKSSGARPSAIPFVIDVGALSLPAVLFCPLGQPVGTLVDLFALRYKVSDRLNTLLSRFLHLRQLFF